jgi:hypothetical protein
MQTYLLIGGDNDGMSIPAPSGTETVQLPLGVTGRETYIRSTLAVGEVSITVYIHESLTLDQVLNRLVEHYRAWCVNRLGGRR